MLLVQKAAVGGLLHFYGETCDIFSCSFETPHAIINLNLIIVEGSIWKKPGI